MMYKNDGGSNVNDLSDVLYKSIHKGLQGMPFEEDFKYLL